MKRFIILALTLLTVNASAAILCQSPNGGVPYAPATLAAAAVSPSCRNTSVVVTTALSAVQSNISSATVHAWPSDRALRVEKGGSIGNTTNFAFASGAVFQPADYQVFTGSGAVTGLKEARPEYFAVNTTPGTTDLAAAIRRAAASLVTGGRLKFSGNQKYAVGSSITPIPSSIIIEGDSAGFTTDTEGTTIWVLSSMTSGIVFDLSNADYVTIRNLNFKHAGKDVTANTVSAISDTEGSGASFTLVDRNHFQWFGGDVIRFFGGVNTITHNRADNSGANFIHLAYTVSTGGGSSDNFIAFNESGGLGSGSATQDTLTGSALYLDNATNNTIVNNQLYNYTYGVYGEGYTAFNRIEGNRFEKHTLAGLYLETNCLSNNILGNNFMNNGSVATSPNAARAGVWIEGSNNNSVVGNYFFNHPSTSNGAYDSPPGTGYWSATAVRLSGGAFNNSIKSNHIFDNKSFSTPGSFLSAAIYLLGASNNDISDNHIYYPETYGIAITNNGATSSPDNKVAGNYIFGASRLTTNTYDAILLSGDASGTVNKTMVAGNTIRKAGSGAATRYGIRVNSAYANDTSIYSNDVQNAGQSGNISNAGTQTEIRMNRGFATDTYGAAIVQNGATTAVVNHSLGVTPNIANISVTPTNNLGSASQFWISTITSTQFTINVDVDPGATTATFVWRAEANRTY